MRLDVGWAAGEQDAIKPGQQFVEIALAERRNDDRHRIGRLGNGCNVLLPDAVEGVRTQYPAIRWDANQWFVASHV